MVVRQRRRWRSVGGVVRRSSTRGGGGEGVVVGGGGRDGGGGGSGGNGGVGRRGSGFLRVKRHLTAQRGIARTALVLDRCLREGRGGD